MAEIDTARVAILVADGFEESELFVPLDTLETEGVTVHVMSNTGGSVSGWSDTDWGEDVTVDVIVSDANVEDYDGLIIPGGRISPDLLREDPDVVKFVRRFYDSGRMIAAICHGPWLLIEADLVRGLRSTSYKSIATDMRNAGAKWLDESVVVDSNIITSRDPDDLDDFTDAILTALREQISDL